MALGRAVLVGIGLTSLAVGIVGIFVPLLPTTVFLLIAAACFARSSERLHRWLLGHPWFGPYITNYREHRAITRRAKIVSLVALWGTLAVSSVAAPPYVWIRLILLCVGIGVTLLLLRLKTMTPEMEQRLDAALQGRGTS